jgi:hypothetical protein
LQEPSGFAGDSGAGRPRGRVPHKCPNRPSDADLPAPSLRPPSSGVTNGRRPGICALLVAGRCAWPRRVERVARRSADARAMLRARDQPIGARDRAGKAAVTHARRTCAVGQRLGPPRPRPQIEQETKSNLAAHTGYPLARRARKTPCIQQWGLVSLAGQGSGRRSQPAPFPLTSIRCSVS